MYPRYPRQHDSSPERFGGDIIPDSTNHLEIIIATLKELLAQEEQLVAQREALTRQIAQAKQAERSGAIAEVKSLMAAHGLTLADLGTRSAAAPKAVGPSKKVAAKYRNTATGDSWSGRGLQPNWLKRALVDGRSLDEFKV